MDTWEEFAVVTGGAAAALTGLLTGLLNSLGQEWGLHPLVPAVIAALVGGVPRAWLFMMSTR